MLRTFTPLLILVSAARFAQQPQADPKARALLREACERWYRWNADFPGFTGRVSIAYQGMEREGTARVTAAVGIEVTAPAARAANWAREVPRAITVPLQPSSFDLGDGRHPATFGPPDAQLSGRAIRLHDESHTLYRLRDGQIWRIERDEGPAGEVHDRILLDFLDFARTEDGLLLPCTYTRSHLEAGTRCLQRVVTIANTYQRLGEFYVPYIYRELVAEDGGTETRWLRQTELKLLS